MAILRDVLTPTILSNVIATGKKTSMLNPQPGGPQQGQQQDPNQQQGEEPTTKDNIIAGLQKMAGRPAVPELNPGARVKNADTSLTQPDNFKGFYDMLGSISQRGQSMTAAAEAQAAYKRAQASANISGQYGGGGGGASTGGSAGSPYTGSVGKGVEQWRGTALQVMKEIGIPDKYIGDVLRRMNQESGGNPNIINNWDSNAKAGHPSQGLMQTIPSTFASNAGKYANKGIFDPYANIYAGLMYAGNRYGPTHGGFLGGVIYAMNKPGGY
jgi:hypothetical protein